MSTTFHAVSERYAKALFALAHSSLEAVESDLSGLRHLITANDELARFAANPLLPRAAKAEAIDAVLAKGNANALTRQFVRRLALNGRLSDLPAIAERFESMLAESRGEVVAEITSATPMSADETRALAESVAGKLGRRVRVHSKVDSELLAGVKVQIGGKLIDYSLNTQLSRLARELKAAT